MMAATNDHREDSYMRSFARALITATAILALVSPALAQTKPTSKPTKTAAATGSTDNPVVIMKTSKGTLKIELFKDKAPKSVENFLRYTNDKYYDGTVFHRVIKGFMIQGGGFSSDMQKKETYDAIPIESKNGLKNKRGTLAMARTNDPNSATSQFFINVVDNAFLDYKPQPGKEGYAVFGRVIEGMDVVEAIRNVPTATKGRLQNVPVEPVTIESVTWPE